MVWSQISVFADQTADKSKLSLSYNVVAEFDATPLIYSQNQLGLNLGGKAGFGVKFNNKYEVGFIFEGLYHTMGRANGSNLAGAEIQFGWSVFGATVFYPFFALYYQLGVNLVDLSYFYLFDGSYRQTAVGPKLRIEPRFYIPTLKYIDFAFILQADLNISEFFLPTVYGGLRINAHPYVTFLSIFFEVGANYNHYEDKRVTHDSGNVLLSCGLSLDLTISGKSKKQNELAQNNDGRLSEDDGYRILADSEKEKTNVERQTKDIDENLSNMSSAKIVDTMDEETKERYEDIIAQLEHDTGARVVAFDDVLFAPNEDKMLDGGDKVLDQIITLLKSNDKYRVNICGYTNELGNDEEQIVLSSQRVAAVISYLRKNGISKSRYTVAALGGQNVKKFGITSENRRVEIRVLEDK